MAVVTQTNLPLRAEKKEPMIQTERSRENTPGSGYESVGSFPSGDTLQEAGTEGNPAASPARPETGAGDDATTTEVVAITTSTTWEG